jgi:hypothetical protein
MNTADDLSETAHEERPEVFAIGTRVIVNGDSWPDGTRGVVACFPTFVVNLCSEPPGSSDDFLAGGLARRVRTPRGIVYSQYVEFDSPTDDGSGDGPYGGSEIQVTYLEALLLEREKGDRP